jgi:hypothetical protein
MVRMMDDKNSGIIKSKDTEYLENLFSPLKSKRVKEKQFDSFFFTLASQESDAEFFDNNDNWDGLALDFIDKTVRVYIYSCIYELDRPTYTNLYNELSDIVFDTIFPLVFFVAKSKKFKSNDLNFLTKNWKKAVIHTFNNFKNQEIEFKYFKLADVKLSADLVFISLIISSYALVMLTNKKYVFGIFLMNQANFILGIASTGIQVEMDDFLKEFYKKDVVKEEGIKNGQKGGLSKGKKFKKPRKLALDYHDKYFAGKDEQGNFYFTAPKAAEKIINELREKGHQEINEYGVSSLANIIRNHRK